MICPFRINRETIYYGCEPRNCTVHEWFEDCEEGDCPYFNKDGKCDRVNERRNDENSDMDNSDNRTDKSGTKCDSTLYGQQEISKQRDKASDRCFYRIIKG